MRDPVTNKEALLMQTLRGDGHPAEEVADLVDRDLNTVLKTINHPKTVAYLARKRQELLDGTAGAAMVLGAYALQQLKACLEEASPKDKMAVIRQILQHELAIRKLEAEAGTRTRAEHLVIERKIGHTLDRPEEMTPEERETVIRKTAYDTPK
jgi:hypothetical protein